MDLVVEMKSIIRAIILLFALQGAAWGATQNLYFDDTTDASEDGTITHPFDSFDDINWVTVAGWISGGDTVQMNIKYGATITDSGDYTLVIGASGASGRVILWQPYGTESDGLPIIQNTNTGYGSISVYNTAYSYHKFYKIKFRARFCAVWIQAGTANVSNWELSECVIDHTNAQDIAGYDSIYISGAGGNTASNVTISSCTFTGNNGSNYFHGIKQEIANNITIQDCTFTLFGGTGINCNGGSGLVIKRNKLYSNGFAGMKITALTAAQSSPTISYNLMYSNGYWAAVFEEISGGKIANNTFVCAGTAGAVAWEVDEPEAYSDPENIVFQNNILVANYSYGVMVFYRGTKAEVEADFTTLNNNLYWQSGAETKLIGFLGEAASDITESNFAANWVASHSAELNADPLLNSSYGIADNSPAKDAGTAITGLHSGNSITGGDAASNTFLYGSGIDIGAYEIWQGHYQHMFGFTQPIPKIYTIP